MEPILHAAEQADSYCQMDITIVKADYHNSSHARAIEDLLSEFALEPSGGGVPLNPETHSRLVEELSKIPHAFSVLAFVNEQPVGLLNCFIGFCTFAVKPLVNIHDCVVSSNFRRHGICTKLLAFCEDIAKERGCCRITLEVLLKNKKAQGAYLKHGFEPYVLTPSMGPAQFWSKTISQR